MPLRLISKTFTDSYGNTSNVLKANAGDKVSALIEFERTIVATSSNGLIFTANGIEDIITRNTGSWIDDGFVLGNAFFRVYSASTGIISSDNVVIITEISHSVLKVTGLAAPVVTSDSSTVWYISQALEGLTTEFYLNFVPNTGSYTDNSLIDSEKTMFSGSVSLLDTYTDIPQIGKKSGNFEISNLEIKKATPTIASPYHTQRQFVKFDMIVPNILFEDEFSGTDCLNLVFKLMDRLQKVDVIDSSNTGYFEEAFNNDSTVLVANNAITTTVNYNQNTVIPFDIDCSDLALNFIEIGACYIALDENYNLNKLSNQSELLHLLKTGLIGLVSVGSDYDSLGTNPYNFALDTLTITDALGVRTFAGQLTMTPNTFETFIDAKEVGNKRFIIWAKVGNTNTVLFDGQLNFVEPVGVAFTPDSNDVVNKYQNTDYSDLSNPINATDINIHDDLAFTADFKLDVTQINDNVKVSIVVKNDVTSEEFQLEQATFDLSNQDLNYFVNIVNSVNNSLPSLSAKKKAYLIKKGAIVANELPLRLYYSFLNRWEYWIEQLNAIPYFQSLNITGKNWFEYINGDFKVYIKLTKNVNGVNDFFYRELPITNYEDSTITSTIELFEYPSLTPISQIKKGADILVRATHTAPTAFETPLYGDITLETFEGFNCFWINNVYDTDLGQNPLKGLSGSKQMSVSYPSTTITRFECLLDTTKLNDAKYTITSKISEDNGIVPQDFNNDFNNDFL